jgi:hypothetical protein
MFYKYLISLLFIVVINACVIPVDDFVQISSKTFVIFECHLNDSSFPLQKVVKLNFSSRDISDTSPNFIPNAKIFVKDNEGNIEFFKEDTENQQYKASTNFRGKVGNTYILHVELPDGRKYESLPETMRPAPDLKNAIISSKFEVVEPIQLDTTFDGRAARVGFTMSASFEDSPSLGDNYRLTWQHFERSENCAICNGLDWYDYEKNKCIFNPTPRGGSAGPLKFQCEGDCWNRTVPNEVNPILVSDKYYNGQRIGDIKVGRVPFSDYSPYFFQLLVQSITPNTFKYYESLKNQTQDNGSQFDIPAETKFNFNIKSLTNPDEKILGIFDVHSVSIKSVFVDRNKKKQNIPIQENPVFVEPGPQFALCYTPCPAKCNESETRTKIKPVDWKD